MCAANEKSSLLGGIVKMKCPNCRTGKAFINESVFPLGKSQQLIEYCSVCGQKMMHERNNGPGINYAVTVVLFFINLLWYWPIFGLSWFDDSLYYFMAVSTAVVLIVQPWSMRYSRILYLYMWIPYQSNKYVKRSAT